MGADWMSVFTDRRHADRFSKEPELGQPLGVQYTRRWAARLLLVVVSLLIIGASIDGDSVTPLARALSLLDAKASVEAAAPAAATPIGGTLTGNTHLAAGDYEVVSHLRVPVGISLSIDAGAHISFPASYGISVNGTLQVLGTASAPVVFTSGRASPQAGDWSGISIVGNATDVLITHARIEYAATALTF